VGEYEEFLYLVFARYFFRNQQDLAFLAGLLFNIEFEKNPPFGGNKEEYIALLLLFLSIQKIILNPPLRLL
jgi:hypothetical protein